MKSRLTGIQSRFHISEDDAGDIDGRATFPRMFSFGQVPAVNK